MLRPRLPLTSLLLCLVLILSLILWSRQDTGMATGNDPAFAESMRKMYKHLDSFQASPEIPGAAPH
jgi:hypothetical protein